MSRDRQFCDGAARAFYVDAYMTAAEEDETGLMPTPGPGEDWAYCAPETHPLAYVYVGALLRGLGFSEPTLLINTADIAEGNEVNAYELGWYLALQAVGHGVAWEDSHRGFYRQRVDIWPDPGLMDL